VNLEEYRILFLTVVAVVALLVASPALSRLLVYPRTEFFTELWLLGPNHMGENYPYNITRGQNYSVFLGIANHLGYAGYYLVEVKFRNRTQSAPYDFGPLSNRTPSSLPSLYNVSAFVADEGTWEERLTFSFDYANTTLSTVQMNSLRLNNVDLNMSGYTITWDSQTKTFVGFLFFELWIYNGTTSVFQYHQRDVRLTLNMTVT
jgi:hypothetical protein